MIKNTEIIIIPANEISDELHHSNIYLCFDKDMFDHAVNNVNDGSYKVIVFKVNSSIFSVIDDFELIFEDINLPDEHIMTFIPDKLKELKKMLQKKIGDNFSKALKRLNMTDREAAEKFGVSKSLISKIKTGQGSLDADDLPYIKAISRISPSSLLEGTNKLAEDYLKNKFQDERISVMKADMLKERERTDRLFAEIQNLIKNQNTETITSILKKIRNLQKKVNPKDIDNFLEEFVKEINDTEDLFDVIDTLSEIKLAKKKGVTLEQLMNKIREAGVKDSSNDKK